MSFDTLGLAPEFVRVVADEGYTEPTPVQTQAIPLVLQGRDLLAGAQTGTGKTAAFVLPMLQLLHNADPLNSSNPAVRNAATPGRNGVGTRGHVRALVLAPTRELALQVEESVRTYGRHRPIRSVAIYGGVGFEPQARALRQGAAICKDLGVKPEFEIFDTGNLWFVKQMIKEGLVLPPPLIQLCMGIAWGAPANTEHLLAMKNFMPEGAVWSSFAISRMQMPWVANSVVNGGNVRVGLEDNLYLSKGVYASNAQLVTKARGIVEAMGARVIGPAEVRERLKIG